MKKSVVLSLLLINFSLLIPCSAQYRVLHNFGSIPGDGSTPRGSLTLLGGKLYGITEYGGTRNEGVIFSIDTNGTHYKILLDFDSINGLDPWSNLIPIGNALYGMVSGGGGHNSGCIFSIDTNGNGYRDIFDFKGPNGAYPLGSLIFVNNKLYGMTYFGGYGKGVVFSVDTNGDNEEVLLDFATYNGSYPRGSLIYAAGVLYGMTPDGGNGPDYGTVFSIDTDGTNFQQLYEFLNIAWPMGSLTRAGNKLYGMTSQGGLDASGVNPGFGNIFSIDTDGNNYTEFFDFIGGITGYSPYGSLTLSGNKFYGMTYVGGGIFSIDTNGSGFDTIHDFDYSGGVLPWGDVTISGNMLYGMTSAGGADSVGVIFSFNYVTAGINELKAESEEVKVYPNPSNGVFALSCHSERSEESNPMIEVYNVLGEKVYSSSFTINNLQFTINLSAQPNGVYLYRVISENGNLIGEGKMVVQR